MLRLAIIIVSESSTGTADVSEESKINAFEDNKRAIGKKCRTKVSAEIRRDQSYYVERETGRTASRFLF